MCPHRTSCEGPKQTRGASAMRDEALRRMLVAPAGLATLVGPEREREVRDAIVAGLSSYGRPDGSYRLENEFHFLVARA